jgi:hypothetical protein
VTNPSERPNFKNLSLNMVMRPAMRMSESGPFGHFMSPQHSVAFGACRRMLACWPSQHVALKRSSVALKYDDPFRLLPPDMELSIDDAKQLLPT